MRRLKNLKKKLRPSVIIRLFFIKKAIRARHQMIMKVGIHQKDIALSVVWKKELQIFGKMAEWIWLEVFLKHLRVQRVEWYTKNLIVTIRNACPRWIFGCLLEQR